MRNKTKIKDHITPDIDRIVRTIYTKLPQKALAYYKLKTPVGVGKKKGNARKKTKLRRNEIHANYPYADVLDKGLYPNPVMTVENPRSSGGYSKLAPEGMSKPTKKYLDKLVKKIFKGKVI